jgi:hypothetical protein
VVEWGLYAFLGLGNVNYPFSVAYDFMNWSHFCVTMCAEQKQQKVSEIKAALDDADVLVLCRKYLFYFLCWISQIYACNFFFFLWVRFEKWTLRQEVCSQVQRL